jgi:hypothetical protein
MEIDATKQALQSVSRKLTSEEKARRRALNLCLYCGNPGHIAMNCQVKKSNQGKARVQPL